MNTNNSFLIIGADGMIGKALSENLGGTVWETTHLQDTLSNRRIFLDMTRDVSGWNPPEDIAVAFICAAVTSLESCRLQPEQSALLNVHNTITVAKKLIEKHIFTVFLSTNLVFDGTLPYRRPEDQVCPTTEYGRQKAEAERQLLALNSSVSVIRFTKILGPNSLPLKNWIESIKKEEVIHPFLDMLMAPVYLSFAIDVMVRVAAVQLPGIVQVSAKDDVSYVQVAQHLARRIGAKPRLVQPILASDSGLNLEAAPLYTTLNTNRLRFVCGMVPPDAFTTIDTVFGLL